MATEPATVQDYTALFGPPSDAARCAAHLARAARVIDAECARAGLDPSRLLRASVVDVMCDMVRYATDPGGVTGATSYSSTAGPFAQTVQLQAPSGSMHLTAAHRRLLGIPAQVIRQYSLLPHPGGGANASR